MAARGANQGISLIRRACHEAPDLVASVSFGILGVFLTGYALNKHSKNKERSNMYRYNYTVMRAEDVDDPKKLGTIYN